MHLLTLNRPDQLNTMTAELCEALHAELAELAADRSCRAIVLTGAGRGFCAGLDLHGYGEAPGNDGSDAARDRLGNQEHMSRLILRLRETPQPVIAAVNGPAAGFGLALTLGSDIRYAARSGRLPGDLRQHRRLELRHGRELAAAAADRRLALARADADRPPRAGRGGGADRPGRRGGRRRPGRRPRALEAAEQIAAWAPWGVRLTKQGMWAALEIPAEQAAVEYEDRQQIMATTGSRPRRRCARSSRSGRPASPTNERARRAVELLVARRRPDATKPPEEELDARLLLRSPPQAGRVGAVSQRVGPGRRAAAAASCAPTTRATCATRTR